jgi:hypothetical protein
MRLPGNKFANKNRWQIFNHAPPGAAIAGWVKQKD